ncbi:MAG: DNA-3-methyladenine glycosylase family protein [Acidimicrobiales bacterium]
MNGAPAALAVAEAELARRDPVLAGLINRCGPCTLASPRDPAQADFEALASSIVYQQLAGRAAAAIWLRVRALVPGDFTAEAVITLEPAALRAAGLSGAKAASVADLSARVADRSLDLDRVARLSDEEVVAELSQVRGIGRWTAQMFLIFQLRRLDVWPTGDLGVRRGWARAYGLEEVPLTADLEALGLPFRPWRSVLAWYCWRAADTVVPAPVAYLPTGR